MRGDGGVMLRRLLHRLQHLMGTNRGGIVATGPWRIAWRCDGCGELVGETDTHNALPGYLK